MSIVPHGETCAAFCFLPLLLRAVSSLRLQHRHLIVALHGHQLMRPVAFLAVIVVCLLYTSDAAAAKVTDKKAMLEAMDNYRNTYPVIKEYRAIRKEKDKQKFHAAHEADFIINDAAKRQLDKLDAPKQLPKRKEVVAEIQSLISKKNECYNDYREKSDRPHELMTMQRN